MKWGRKKQSSPSSSHTSSIMTRVFPFTWFTKPKKKGVNTETNGPWERSELDFPIRNPSYCMDDGDGDSTLRLSFCEERIEGRKSTGVCYNTDDDEFQVPVSSFKSFDLGGMEVARRGQSPSFDNMVSDIKKMKEKQQKDKCLLQNGDFRSKRPNVEPNSYSNLEGEKLKEIKLKTESTTYTSRESDSRKIKPRNRVKRAYSPRTECKIRLLEDMKKARTKLKKQKETQELAVTGKTVYDSFAVVKTSYNPQQDFRDSMIEMIYEKGIHRPDELEDLLASYLTLNCDEYHDIIINVFQQVWFDLNRGLILNS